MRVSVFQRVAECCRLLQSVAVNMCVLMKILDTIQQCEEMRKMRVSVLQCVAECCSVLQCVVAYCRVLQSVAVCVCALMRMIDAIQQLKKREK